MYIKVMASIMILVGFSSLGFYYAYKMVYRKSDLLEIKRAVLGLASEIKFLSSINEAILNIEEGLSDPIKSIFVTFRGNMKNRRGEELYILWSDAIKTGSTKTYLTKEDKQNIMIIGKVIGGIDKEFSIEGLNIVIEYIDVNVKEIDREKNKNMKMYQSLGIFSGLILIILLV